jgi:hypothetical protein
MQQVHFFAGEDTCSALEKAIRALREAGVHQPASEGGARTTLSYLLGEVVRRHLQQTVEELIAERERALLEHAAE